jgi:hypothetical protein
MYQTDELQKKWQPVLEHADLPSIADAHKRSTVATLLENQERNAMEQASQSGGAFRPSLLGEAAPANATGGSVDNFDPVLISLVRRSMPNLIAYDVCGVQPMTGPTGLIFAMKSRYTGQSGTEALFNTIDTTFSGSASANAASQLTIGNGKDDRGTGAAAGTDPTSGTYTVSTGMDTANAEALGDGAANGFNEMAFSIDKVAVTAVSRALKAEYTMELAQDLKAIHGLDAEQELSNILSSEILAEINREVIRTINITATAGAATDTTSPGTFDLDTDSNGRWSVEKFKGLIFQIERDANKIAKDTRRGKGNVMICSSDVASALNMAGVLDYTPALTNNLQVDDSGNTFAGVLNGRIKVYIDPYTTGNYYTLGYKGTSAFDAGLFYCPYVPLQMVRAVGENTFQPKIGFKTRYGMVANPFATSEGAGVVGVHADDKNIYYRKVVVANLM